jgi:hypothetical protein
MFNMVVLLVTVGVGRAGSLRRTGFICGLLRRLATPAVAASMRPVPAMATMTAVAKKVHGDKRHAEQRPEPVLCKPGHAQLLVLTFVIFMAGATPQGVRVNRRNGERVNG